MARLRPEPQRPALSGGLSPAPRGLVPPQTCCPSGARPDLPHLPVGGDLRARPPHCRLLPRTAFPPWGPAARRRPRNPLRTTKRSEGVAREDATGSQDSSWVTKHRSVVHRRPQGIGHIRGSLALVLQPGGGDGGSLSSPTNVPSSIRTRPSPTCLPSASGGRPADPSAPFGKASRVSDASRPHALPASGRRRAKRGGRSLSSRGQLWASPAPSQDEGEGDRPLLRVTPNGVVCPPAKG